MILSSTSDSRKTKKAITLILKELDFHLCCEIVRTTKHKKSFVVLNWVIDEEDFYIAHLMYKKRKTNWLCLMDLIPILGEVWIHYDMFGNGQTRPTDGMTRMQTTLYHWQTGIDFLHREGIDVDTKQCFSHMLKETTKWTED